VTDIQRRARRYVLAIRAADGVLANVGDGSAEVRSRLRELSAKTLGLLDSEQRLMRVAMVLGDPMLAADDKLAAVADVVLADERTDGIAGYGATSLDRLILANAADATKGATK
jgi:hypothetical protein